MDTIYASASAAGKSGVHVVRVSGTLAGHVANSLTNQKLIPRRATHSKLITTTGQVIDRAMVIYFQAPRSFTGENVVEFHIHGSKAVLDKLFKELSEFSGLRFAEPGEFTKRALLNGKLSLTEVEGLADLIDSETEEQRKIAEKIMSGALANRAEGWRKDLIRAASLLEASLDFSDDEVPYDVTPEVTELVRKVSVDLKSDMVTGHVSERIQSGFEVAIVGRPNVGKSTLLNYLAGRDAAITSEVAGTTRDVIEVKMDLKGFSVTLVDTAGIRDPTEQIERLGIELAQKRFEQSDVAIFLVEPERLPVLPPRENDIVLIAQGDLHGFPENSVSGATGYGVDALITRLVVFLETKAAGAGLATRERHRVAITDAFNHLNLAAIVLQMGTEKYEIVAEELRAGIGSLDALIGHVDIEEVLGEIFSSFCIGK